MEQNRNSEQEEEGQEEAEEEALPIQLSRGKPTAVVVWESVSHTQKLLVSFRTDPTLSLGGDLGQELLTHHHKISAFPHQPAGRYD